MSDSDSAQPIWWDLYWLNKLRKWQIHRCGQQYCIRFWSFSMCPTGSKQCITMHCLPSLEFQCSLHYMHLWNIICLQTTIKVLKQLGSIPWSFFWSAIILRVAIFWCCLMLLRRQKTLFTVGSYNTVPIGHIKSREKQNVNTPYYCLLFYANPTLL